MVDTPKGHGILFKRRKETPKRCTECGSCMKELTGGVLGTLWQCPKCLNELHEKK